MVTAYQYDVFHSRFFGQCYGIDDFLLAVGIYVEFLGTVESALHGSKGGILVLFRTITVSLGILQKDFDLRYLFLIFFVGLVAAFLAFPPFTLAKGCLLYTSPSPRD